MRKTVTVIGASFLAVVALALPGASSAQIETPRSPALSSLLVRLQGADTARAATTVDDFLVGLRGRAPLFERPEGMHPDSVLVTVVWRGKASGTENVAIFSSLTPWKGPENRLEPLAGTDLWYRSWTVRSDLRFVYRMIENDNGLLPREDAGWSERAARLSPDPLNPDTTLLAPGAPASVGSAPEAVPLPWGVEGPPDPEGSFDTLRIEDRYAVVYSTRAGSGNLAPIRLVLFDGWVYREAVHLPQRLDRNLAEGRLPSIQVAFVAHRDRGADLQPNPEFASWVADSLLGEMDRRWGAVARERTVVAGASFGGLAALHIGRERAGRFGAVVAQSGSYWWGPPHAPDSQWLLERIAGGGMPRLPDGSSALRVALDAGALENRPARGGPSMRDLTRQTRLLLCALDVPVVHREFEGGHEYVNWAHTVIEALVDLYMTDPPPDSCRQLP